MKRDKPLANYSEILPSIYERETSQAFSVDESISSDDQESLVLKHILYGTNFTHFIMEDTGGDQLLCSKTSLCK